MGVTRRVTGHKSALRSTRESERGRVHANATIRRGEGKNSTKGARAAERKGPSTSGTTRSQRVSRLLQTSPNTFPQRQRNKRIQPEPGGGGQQATREAALTMVSRRRIRNRKTNSPEGVRRVEGTLPVVLEQGECATSRTIQAMERSNESVHSQSGRNT